MVSVVASACSKNPTQPSVNSLSGIPQPPPVAVTLSNLSGHYVGISNQLCGDTSASVPIDDLELDYQVTGASLAGASLSACDSDACDTSVPLGTIVQCPVPPDPCAAGTADAIAQDAAPACLTGDSAGSGSVQVLALHPGAAATWNVKALGDSGYASNLVSTGVDQGPVASSDGSMGTARSFRRLRRLHR